jgi:hypothetical protein
MSIAPYWVDAIAAAVKTGDETERAAALGGPVRKRFRIDYSRRFESQSRGGKKGGKAPKRKRHE